MWTEEQKQEAYRRAKENSRITKVLVNGPFEEGDLCSAIVEVDGAKCEGCGKEIKGEAEVSGFGGMYHPVYYFTCTSCKDKSQMLYEISCLDVDRRNSELAEEEGGDL